MNDSYFGYQSPTRNFSTNTRGWDRINLAIRRMESRETQNEDVLRGRGWIATPSAVPRMASNQKIEKCELRWNQQLQKIKTAHEPCATVLLRAGSLGFCPAIVRDNFRKEETREKLGIFVQHMRVFGPWKGRARSNQRGRIENSSL